MKYLVLFLANATLLACTNPTGQRPEHPVYYDVAGYVKGQIDVLSRQQPGVVKRLKMGKRVEEKTTRTVNWSRELELFTQADINKPALRGSYTISRPDSLTYRYTLKPGEKELSVRSLSIRLDSVTHRPRRIDAVLATENPLYQSERQISLDSGPLEGNKWGVTHYHLQGFQHLSLSERTMFDVEGTVVAN